MRGREEKRVRGEKEQSRKEALQEERSCKRNRRAQESVREGKEEKEE